MGEVLEYQYGNKTIELSELVDILSEEQLSLFFSEDSSLNPNQKSSSNKNEKISLGQVFTPPILAGFMSSLIKKQIKKQSAILDPCIGPNTFFKHFKKIAQSHDLTGIELDSDLISQDVKEFYALTENELIEGSFFKLPLNKKYDFIIQNPPYVRQELMVEGDNAKSNAILPIANFHNVIPSKSNLYVYFLLKSILHLKEGGRLVAVIYDSWLYSSFGEFLKKMFLELGELETIYHFKHNAFPDAEVGATVIEFVRSKSTSSRKQIKYYSLSSLKDIQNYKKTVLQEPTCIRKKQFLSWNFNGLSAVNFKSDFFIPLNSLTDQPIQRGISSLANKYFIHTEKVFPESKPFIKDVNKLKSYTVKDELSYFLSINGSISEKTKEYLDTVKKEILSNNENYKALKEKIKSSSNWFRISIKQPGNFVFNYYLRKNIDFILNLKLEYASDNFYILNIPDEPKLLLSILNSNISRLSVLRHSRSQGNGLRKIQLYEFKMVSIPNYKCFSPKAISELKRLGGQLQTVQRYSKEPELIIKDIDHVIISEYNNVLGESLSIADIHNELNELIKNR